MSMTDPIADLLTRVRNAVSAGHRSVDIPASKLKREISRVLAEERFIDNFAYYDDGKQGQLRLYLRYTADNTSVIQGLRRISKPGLRRHATKGELPRIRRGLGVAIVSTSRGVMTDRDARRVGIGGEILCSVW
jgi:small subunit ribosomal protein S8